MTSFQQPEEKDKLISIIQLVIRPTEAGNQGWENFRCRLTL